MTAPPRSPRRSRLQSRLGRVEQAAANALEVMRLGRLTARRDTPYEIVHQGHHYRLRRYGEARTPGRPVILLVPPLMVTAEVYDVAPDLSAVTTLVAAGIDTWVVDFGAPEHEEGGMSRTLDDHVHAVVEGVARVRAMTGRDLHLAGYSQGGMFTYQVAAYLGGEGIASVITFGSPVDIHKSLPNVGAEVTARMLQAVRPLVEPTLTRIEGLPGVITSLGFKVLSARKEAAQLVDFVRKLHDRQALEKREARRRFLGGEGFVAWPGPAFRKFVDEFVVHNRMLSGGFVIEGRTVTLAEMRCPVLSFVGLRDEIARPRAVRAISRAAPHAEVFEVDLVAGHFGLVVGTTANRFTWPTVIEWMRWREGQGPRPVLLPESRPTPATPVTNEAADEEVENEAIVDALDVELFYDVMAEAFRGAWNKLGEAFVDAGDTADALRFQLPRLLRLRQMQADTPVSFGRELAEQARAIPDRTFFLWKGRAFSYAEAERRVDAVVRGLHACGVRAGDRVGVLMEGRPSYLTMTTALNRLGAVAVLVSPGLDAEGLARALALEPLRFVAADPENAARARAAFARDVLVLGGGPGGGSPRALAPDVIDMEAIDPWAVTLPEGFLPNPGHAGDLAMVIISQAESGHLRAARITNRRWALSALGAAAACTIKPSDTVYSCLPLHHPAGLLVSVSAALVGGARLALATRFAPEVFWSEVRSYGATIAFYAGEMIRELMNAPHSAEERRSPLRLFAGSGMRADVWRRLTERTGVGVLEFYASTEGTLVLANAAGEKIGSLGRPLPGSTEAAIAAYDGASGSIARDALGRGRRVGNDEPGLLLARVDAIGSVGNDRVQRDVFELGDAWLPSGDLVRRDESGDFWFVDRLADVIRTDFGPVPSRPIEDALYELPEVALAAVYGIPIPGEAGEVPTAAVVLQSGAHLDGAALFRALETLPPEARPRYVRIVDAIPMTEGYRLLKAGLRAAGLPADGRALVRDVAHAAYVESGTARS
ncbi:Polyhydroxyalkanoic acid synthase [Minicystis rosea]|nr:Polyhydroxyalkanoic acid synthase [Minicystis rosea]